MDESEVILAKQIINIKYDATWSTGNILMLSICDGHLEVVKYLVSLGVDIMEDDNNAVRLAASCGQLEVLKYLVSLGADPVSKNNFAIRYAALHGYLDTIKYLVSVGADVNIALTNCIWFGRKKIIEYLVSVGGHHKLINLYDYVSILDYRHLKYPIDDRLRKIILARENQKRVMTDYWDIIVVTVA